MINKPMLAVAIENLEDLHYPILATPKLDGIRCLKINGKALTRNFKPIPNTSIREAIEKSIPYDNVDGEIIVPNCNFNEITSIVMSEEGNKDFEYHIFDYVKNNISIPYYERMSDLSSIVLPEWCIRVLPFYVDSKKHLLEYEEKCISEGYEGVMVRSYNGPYKCGRSTLREGYLLKLKRFKDSEAEIIGFIEKMHNSNEAKKDELGRTKRSSHKANLISANTLGTLLVKDLTSKQEFGIGSGFDDSLRTKIWSSQKSYLGKIVKYKYQPSGMKDLPRFPVFLGFRDKRDF